MSPAATLPTRRHGLRALLTAATIASVLPAAAQAPSHGSRIRATDRKAACVLVHGLATSPTVVRLAVAVERSDLYVHVETALMKELGLRGIAGTMRIVAATPRGRYVRVTISVPDGNANLVAALAHELQHAAEIAPHPEIRNADDLRRFYRIRGFRKPDGTYCTKAAVNVFEAVRGEVATALAASNDQREASGRDPP